MKHNLPSSSNSLGADLRALRKARGLSLTDLAATLNRSVGWLSQVERDLSEPSVPDLRMMADKLGVSLSIFFGQAEAPTEELGYVVRKGSRRALGEQGGLIEELLSPDLTDDFEVVHSTFQPGSTLTHTQQRDTQEVAYLATGKLDIWIGENAFTIQAGDSFRLRGEPYRWANPYAEPAMAIWVISPPVY